MSPGSDREGHDLAALQAPWSRLPLAEKQEDLNGRDDVTGARLYLFGLPLYAGLLYLLGQWVNL